MKLAHNLAGPREIISVVFFTSPTDRKTDAVNYANQQRFFEAIKKTGVILRLGKLVSNERKCPQCKKASSFKSEKSVDVQLAMELTVGAIEDKWDVAYLATCDSDIIPAINFARDRDKKVFLLIPDGARCHSVSIACNTGIKITQERIDACQAFE